MPVYRHREETLNTQLAILLSRFGVQADAETIQVKGRERPEVLFVWRGLRVIIEGKFADHANAREVVLQDARGRVQRGIAHIAAAVVHPSPLRQIATSELLDSLAREPGLTGKSAMDRPVSKQTTLLDGLDKEDNER